MPNLTIALTKDTTVYTFAGCNNGSSISKKNQAFNQIIGGVGATTPGMICRTI